jgi:hypothetical protein
MPQHTCRRVLPGAAPTRQYTEAGAQHVYIPSASLVDTYATSMWCPTRRAAALTTNVIVGVSVSVVVTVTVAIAEIVLV